jgi:hypothetical protein
MRSGGADVAAQTLPPEAPGEFWADLRSVNETGCRRAVDAIQSHPPGGGADGALRFEALTTS